MSEERPVTIRLTQQVEDYPAGSRFVIASAAKAQDLYGKAADILGYEDGGAYVAARDASVIAAREAKAEAKEQERTAAQEREAREQAAVAAAKQTAKAMKDATKGTAVAADVKREADERLAPVETEREG